MSVEPFLSIQPLNDSLIRPVVTRLTRQWVDDKVHRLSYLLGMVFFGQRKHKSPPVDFRAGHERIVQQMTMTTSFNNAMLQKKLGGTANSYAKYLTPFFEFPSDAKGFNSFTRRTKPYLLLPEIEEALTKYWSMPGNANPIDKGTGRPLTPKDLPAGGITESVYTNIKVRPLLVFDMGRLNQTINSLERSTDTFKRIVAQLGPYRRQIFVLRHLYAIRKWQSVLGGVPNIYKEKSTGSGRLNGIGRFHLQRIPKNARLLLFKDSGYWSFDFKGCHWYITQSLCRHFSIPSPVVDRYLADKTGTELALAERLELPERNGKCPKVKALLLGLLMKRVLTTSPYSPLASEIGTQSVKLANNGPAPYRWS